jgi:hypothetical protein
MSGQIEKSGEIGTNGISRKLTRLKVIRRRLLLIFMRARAGLKTPQCSQWHDVEWNARHAMIRAREAEAELTQKIKTAGGCI